MHSYRINIMGTVSFKARFGDMRKDEEFIVYPMQDSGTEIEIQSEHRFGRLDLANGVGVLSARRAQYANGMWLDVCRARKSAKGIALAADDLQTLRGWIKSSGGVAVGRSIVISDNTGALAL